MSAAKKGVTPKQTVPLHALTITWPPPNDFEGESTKPVVLSGAKLAEVVGWIARTAPGRLHTGEMWSVMDVRLRLGGLADLLSCLGTLDHDHLEECKSLPSVLALVGHVADDLAGQLAAREEAADNLEHAIVTIAAAAAATS